jgi:FkbM family methyltransferase
MYVDRFRFADAAPSPVNSRTLLREVTSSVRLIPNLLSRAGPILRAYSAFADVQSRIIFRDLLVYRYASPRLSRLANDRSRFEQLEWRMASNITSSPLDKVVTNSLGETLRLWSVRYRGTDLEVITSKYGLYWMLDSDQYYLQRDGIFVGPRSGDVVIDCGCHIGDISLRFAIDVGPNGEVFGFDPDAKHVAISRQNAVRNRLGSRLRFIPFGVSDHCVERGAEQADPSDVNAGRRLAASDATIPIDSFCKKEKITSVDFIKMDIEGSEMEAIRGAEHTIKSCRPKLAICLYHRPDDLWEITNYIAASYPFYRLFLGHHSLHKEETVLYAAPPDNNINRSETTKPDAMMLDGLRLCR